MLKAITLSICAAFLLRATSHATELAGNTAFGTAPATPRPDFQSLRIKGLTIALPGPQDTIDPDFAGIRSSLAALGIGYIGYSNNTPLRSRRCHTGLCARRVPRPTKTSLGRPGLPTHPPRFSLLWHRWSLKLGPCSELHGL